MSWLNMEGMCLNPLSDLEVDVLDEVLEEGYCSKDSTLLRSSAQTKVISMGETIKADPELFLTDYLLNFGEESTRQCYYDGCSSGVECSDNEDDCTLASLKESLKKAKNDCDQDGKSPISGDNNECFKVVSSSVPVKNEAEKMNSLLSKQDKVNQRKARDKARAARNRFLKTQRQKRLEEECVELRESKKILTEKNMALHEKISELEEQVEYLESVIANESALSTILNTLSEHSGLQFQRNSLRLNSLKRKREDNTDVKDGNDVKKENHGTLSPKNGGVCVHIAPGRMSLAFCQECHKNSMKVDKE